MSLAKLGVFSLTGAGPTGDDRDYLAWHQLDHMPEQYQVNGILSGQRWGTTRVTLGARRPQEPLGDVRHVVQYLIGEPVDHALDEFFDLALRLAALGRMRPRPPTLFLSGLPLVATYASPAALVSPEVVPYRPSRGIYLVVEEVTGAEGFDRHLLWLQREHLPEVVRLGGVAGAWLFATAGPRVREAFTPGDHRVTVCYLDEPPAELTPALAARWEESWEHPGVRPLLAAPFESVVSYDWDRFR